ncbi:MAG: GxxExxY protein [Bacteroidaceae bacterium]|nr:GxxExxY protein [Bacteroidaceae bacterium]
MDYKQYKDTVYKIIGAAMSVHSELNWGLLEPIYQEALHLELKDRGIDNEREQEINCYYKHHLLDKKYKMDIVVDDIVVELKSVKELIPAHRAQLFNYMRLTKRPIGLLINFGCSSLQGERYAWIEETNECVLLDKGMELLYDDDVDSDYEYVSYEDKEKN